MNKREELTAKAKSKILDSIADGLTEMFLKSNIGFSYEEVYERYRFRLTRESSRKDIIKWLKLRQKKTNNLAEKSMIESILDLLFLIYRN